MKILLLVPGGQTRGTMPSENLGKHINHYYDDIEVEIHNKRFHPPILEKNCSKFDVIWGDMDNGRTMPTAVWLANKWKKKSYVHGEWFPPYRLFPGYGHKYNEKTQLEQRPKYMDNLEAMKKADLVSLSRDTTEGGFDWLEENFGVTFENKFIRRPACPIYETKNWPKENSVATIATYRTGLKRVDHTIQAIAKSKTKPEFHLIGGPEGMTNPEIKMHSYGMWNTEEKIDIYARSKVAVQHFGGIPEAEAIQQMCPVIAYDIKYMRQLYGDALVWVPENDIDALSSAIDEYIKDDELRERHAKNAYEMFMEGTLGVKPEKYRAELVVKNLRSLF